MEVILKNIHMCRQRKKAETQIMMEEDLNVPDAKPDALRIIQCSGKVTAEHIHTEEEKLYVDGCLEVMILYMDDTKERRLHRLDMKLHFDEKMHMDGPAPEENVRLQFETEDLSAYLINSRKLAVRALLSVTAEVDENYELAAAAEVKTSLEVCAHKSRMEFMQLEVSKKDILRLKEDVLVPSNKPDIGEVLWEKITLQGTQVRQKEGKIEIQGKLDLFVLYRAQDELQSSQWVEQVVPFEGEIVCDGARLDLIPEVEVRLVQAELQPKEDTDGELRIFHMEGMLELMIRLYENQETELLEDVYSPEKNLELVTSEEQYESLVMRNESRCRASGKIRIQSAKPGILQICHVSGSIKVDSAKMVDGGVQIEGAVPVSVLYISADDTAPYAVLEGAIPFSHFAEIPGADPSCRFHLHVGMEQLQATMSDSEEIEIKVLAGLNLFVVRPGTQKCILEIQEKEYTQEQLEAVPGITGYVVKEQDTLWDIARAYYLTPAQIMEMNNLESERIKKGDRLILMKKVRMNV